jgi:hypothetical protein
MDVESVQVPRAPTRQPLWWVPIVSTSIGAFALCFQVFVLYPWHLQLSAEFASLSQACLK